MKIYNLTPKSISEITGFVEDFYEKENVSKKESLKNTLLIEETLLKYRDKFGEDIKVELHTNNMFSKAKVQLLVYCDKMNPFADNDEEGGILKSLMAATEDKATNWKYAKSNQIWLFNSGARNEIVFTVAKRPPLSNPIKISIGLLTGIIMGFVLKAVMGAESGLVFASDYVVPIANVYTGILSVMAVFILFFSMICSIVQYGNAAEFQQETKSIMIRFLTVAVIFTVITTGVSLIGKTVMAASAVELNLAKSLLNIIVGFFPTNLITALANFNCMQVMIIGIMIGFGCMVMGEASKEIVDLFDKLNYLAIIINNYLSNFVYIYVALMAFYFVLSSANLLLTDLIYFIVGIIVLCVIAVILSALIVSLRLKVGFITIWKKFLQTFLVNLSSANLGASYAIFIAELLNNCGVDLSYTVMGTTFGTNVFKPLYISFLVAAGITAASMEGMLTLSVIIEIVILAFILSISIPNIQGGATAIILLMFGQLGLKNTADVFISLNSLLQFIIVPANVFILQCTVVIQGAKENKVNLDILRDPAKVMKKYV